MLESDDLEPAEAYELVGSRRTLTRKRKERRNLSSSESDRLARVVRIIARTEEALGEREKAHRWLRRENRALAGRRPLDLLDSDAGARMVERVRVSDLPPDWNQVPDHPACVGAGDSWARAARTALLRVPSAFDPRLLA